MPELFVLERYPTVWQLTSSVTARPRADVGLVEVFRAMFPCGSVTGAPKGRTMAAITDIETSPRGVYCGAIGFLPPAGSRLRARFSVAIRTAVIDRRRGEAGYGAGGGITYSSDAAAEYEELQAKAAILGPSYSLDVELLETMAFDTLLGVRHLSRHLRRLGRSALHFGYDYDGPAARARIMAAVAGVRARSRVRVRLARDGTLAVELAPLTCVGAPVVLALDDAPSPIPERFLVHKTTGRGHYDDALARHPDAEDVILRGTGGQLTETTRGNLLAEIDGHWWTPPERSGCLPGIGREVLVERSLVGEQRLEPADLAVATRIAVVSSLRGVRRAVLQP